MGVSPKETDEILVGERGWTEFNPRDPGPGPLWGSEVNDTRDLVPRIPLPPR